jgi:hypothetical protein
MLTISKPLSASRVRTYQEQEFASQEQNYQDFWSDLTNPKRYIHVHESLLSNGLVRVACSARRPPLR